MNLKKIEEKLLPLLIPYGYTIYSIKTKREFGEKIIEILVDGDMINHDTLESIHMKLVELLDETELPDDYFLELSTVGAERPINSIEEAEKNVGKYIYLESNQYRGTGTLVGIEDGTLIVNINDKGRFRDIKIKYEDARKMRTSVKF